MRAPSGSRNVSDRGGRSIIVAGDPPYEQKFIWDKDKSDDCLAEREFDFGYAVEVWKDPNRISYNSPRAHTAEKREVTVGKIDQKFYSVVTTRRGEDIRIMSARRSRKEEINIYENYKNNSGD